MLACSIGTETIFLLSLLADPWNVLGYLVTKKYCIKLKMAKLVLKEITNFKNLGHKNSSIYQKQHSFISFNTYLLGQLYARHYK